MPQPGSLGDLEQPHELAFQEREWRVGRVVWTLIFVAIAAAILGLFGSGPISSVTLETADGALRVQSQRFIRYGATLRLIVDVRAAADGQAVLRMSRRYLTSMRVEQILPQPGRTRQDADGVSFTYSGNAPGARTRVIFDLHPAARGRIDGQIAAGAARVHITHFIYP